MDRRINFAFAYNTQQITCEVLSLFSVTLDYSNSEFHYLVFQLDKTTVATYVQQLRAQCCYSWQSKKVIGTRCIVYHY